MNWLSLLKNPKVLLLISAIAIGGWNWYQGLRIDTLKVQKEALIAKVVVAETSLERLLELSNEREKQLVKINEILLEHRKSTQVIAEKVSLNNKIFTDNQHDLENIAVKRPSMLEAKVNKATIRVFAQIEEETKKFKETEK